MSDLSVECTDVMCITTLHTLSKAGIRITVESLTARRGLHRTRTDVALIRSTRSRPCLSLQIGMLVLSYVCEAMGQQLKPWFGNMFPMFTAALQDTRSPTVPLYTIQYVVLSPEIPWICTSVGFACPSFWREGGKGGHGKVCAPEPISFF